MSTDAYRDLASLKHYIRIHCAENGARLASHVHVFGGQFIELHMISSFEYEQRRSGVRKPQYTGIKLLRSQDYKDMRACKTRVISDCLLRHQSPDKRKKAETVLVHNTLYARRVRAWEVAWHAIRQHKLQHVRGRTVSVESQLGNYSALVQGYDMPYRLFSQCQRQPNIVHRRWNWGAHAAYMCDDLEQTHTGHFEHKAYSSGVEDNEDDACDDTCGDVSVTRMLHSRTNTECVSIWHGIGCATACIVKQWLSANFLQEVSGEVTRNGHDCTLNVNPLPSTTRFMNDAYLSTVFQYQATSATTMRASTRVATSGGDDDGNDEESNALRMPRDVSATKGSAMPPHSDDLDGYDVTLQAIIVVRCCVTGEVELLCPHRFVEQFHITIEPAAAGEASTSSGGGGDGGGGFDSTHSYRARIRCDWQIHYDRVDDSDWWLSQLRRVCVGTQRILYAPSSSSSSSPPHAI